MQPISLLRLRWQCGPGLKWLQHSDSLLRVCIEQASAGAAHPGPIVRFNAPGQPDLVAYVSGGKTGIAEFVSQWESMRWPGGVDALPRLQGLIEEAAAVALSYQVPRQDIADPACGAEAHDVRSLLE